MLINNRLWNTSFCAFLLSVTDSIDVDRFFYVFLDKFLKGVEITNNSMLTCSCPVRGNEENLIGVI